MPTEKPPKAKRNKINNLTEAVKQLQEVSQSIHADENSGNEHEAFGNYVAATLKQLRKEDALMAQHDIQGILLKYRLSNVSQVHCNRPDSPNCHSRHSTHSSYSTSSSAYVPPMPEVQNSDLNLTDDYVVLL